MSYLTVRVIPLALRLHNATQLESVKASQQKHRGKSGSMRAYAKQKVVRASGVTVDIKKTSYKNLAKMLKAYEKKVCLGIRHTYTHHSTSTQNSSKTISTNDK